MATRFERDENNKHCIRDINTGALIFVHMLYDAKIEEYMQEYVNLLNGSRP